MESVSLRHHTVVEIAAKNHEPSMQFPQYNCKVPVPYPRVSSLYETDDRGANPKTNYWNRNAGPYPNPFKVYFINLFQYFTKKHTVVINPRIQLLA
jgi:hypothetical protein